MQSKNRRVFSEISGEEENFARYTQIFGKFIPGITLGSRGYFFLIDTDGWGRSCVNEEKNNLWSQEYATSFPCEKSVQDLNWVTDWILPCQVVRCSQSGPLLYC